MEEKKETPEHKYGTVVVASMSKEPREIPIDSFVQARFKDNRLVTVCTLEGNSYAITVENPLSTGRNSSQTVWLSEESLTAFFAATIIMYRGRGKDLDVALKEALANDKDATIEYKMSDNLIPFNTVTRA